MSGLSFTKASAWGSENDPYGGLGRKGALFTPEAKGLAQPLAALIDQQPGPYRFAPGKVYNLKADAVIGDHTDICKHEIAYAMLKAAATFRGSALKHFLGGGQHSPERIDVETEQKLSHLVESTTGLFARNPGAVTRTMHKASIRRINALAKIVCRLLDGRAGRISAF